MYSEFIDIFFISVDYQTKKMQKKFGKQLLSIFFPKIKSLGIFKNVCNPILFGRALPSSAPTWGSAPNPEHFKLFPRDLVVPVKDWLSFLNQVLTFIQFPKD